MSGASVKWTDTEELQDMSLIEDDTFLAFACCLADLPGEGVRLLYPSS